MLPLEFWMSVSAPAASKAVTTSRCPFAAALCRAVVPFCACDVVQRPRRQRQLLQTPAGREPMPFDRCRRN